MILSIYERFSMPHHACAIPVRCVYEQSPAWHLVTPVKSLMRSGRFVAAQDGVHTQCELAHVL